VVPSGQVSADIACSWDYHTSDPSQRGILTVFNTESIIKYGVPGIPAKHDAQKRVGFGSLTAIIGY